MIPGWGYQNGSQDMRRNECGQSRSLAGVVIGRLALTALVILIAAPLNLGASKNDKDHETTRIYQHTYDEVFQASQEAIERMGMFIEEKDKEKGRISGSGVYSGAEGTSAVKMKFDIRIETVSTKPETRVTVTAKGKVFFGLQDIGKTFAQGYFVEVQKVLATYH
jgi:hypothetical protein